MRALLGMTSAERCAWVTRDLEFRAGCRNVERAQKVSYEPPNAYAAATFVAPRAVDDPRYDPATGVPPNGYDLALRALRGADSAAAPTRAERTPAIWTTPDRNGYTPPNPYAAGLAALRSEHR
ncbi:MAG TPA: hypothetical protein VNJ04_18465 [Gemmatimonadaceae bacterium]|nr:hypothetical protein [Gemmatimonadaceae bacterium]